MAKAQYSKTHGKVPFLVCSLLVAMLLFSSVGYAASYQATTNVTGNTIETNYFTIDIVGAGGSHADTVFVDKFNYTMTDDGYMLAGSTAVTASVDDIFVKATDASGTHDEYRMAVLWTLEVVGGTGSIVTSGHDPIMNVIVGGNRIAAPLGSTSDYIDVGDLDTAETLALSIQDVTIAMTSGTPTSVKLSISFMAMSTNTGTYEIDEVSVQIGSSIDAIASYIGDSISPKQGEAQQYYSATIEDDNIVVMRADSKNNNGAMDLSFHIPPGTEFALELRVKLPQGSDAGLVVKLTRAGESSPFHQATLDNGTSGTTSRHFLYSGCGNVGGDTNSIRNDAADFKTDIEPGIGSGWFSGSGGDITLSFESVSGTGNNHVDKGTQILIHLKDISNS